MLENNFEAVNLLGLAPARLADFLAYIGEDRGHTEPLLKLIHGQGLGNFYHMPGLDQALVKKLSLVAKVEPPRIHTTQKSEDGTCKWLFEITGGSCIETVYMPQLDGGTLCLSSQAGCALNCSFCGTGQLGFDRNLSSDEIIGQLWLARHQLALHRSDHLNTISRIVFMGMGEPLLNFRNLIAAIALLTAKNGYDFNAANITLSTAGLVPAMAQLALHTNVRLAISLHAPNDTLRNQLVTINRKYPIRRLLEAAKNYLEQLPLDRRELLVQYVLIDRINDQLTHAQQLAQLLSDLPVRLELIPMNRTGHSQYQPSHPAQVDAFSRLLLDKGYQVAIRPTLGGDINASCGQLGGNVQDRTRRSAKHL